MAVSWLTGLGTQTGYYGLTLWTTTLLVLFLGIRPDQAGFYMLFVTCAAFAGRILMAVLSERIGRRASGVFCSGAAVVLLLGVAFFGHLLAGYAALFVLALMATYVFGEGSSAIVGPYGGEVWPSRLRTTGMGSAYGFGGLGKIIGPAGLALILGTSTPASAPGAGGVSLQAAFVYFAAWYGLAALVFLFLGIETKGRSIEALEAELEGKPQAIDVARA